MPSFLQKTRSALASKSKPSKVELTPEDQDMSPRTYSPSSTDNTKSTTMEARSISLPSAQPVSPISPMARTATVQPRSILKSAPTPLSPMSRAPIISYGTRGFSDIRHDSGEYRKYMEKTWGTSKDSQEDEAERVERERKVRKRMNDVLRYEVALREQIRRQGILSGLSDHLDEYFMPTLERALQMRDYYARYFTIVRLRFTIYLHMYSFQGDGNLRLPHVQIGGEDAGCLILASRSSR